MPMLPQNFGWAPSLSAPNGPGPQMMGVGAPPQPMQPVQVPPGLMGAGTAPGLGGGGMWGGMDPQKLAMMLMGAGSGLGQAAAPSPYKTGLGTALGAGIGGGMAGMMNFDAMKRQEQRDRMFDEMLRGQMGAKMPGMMG